MATQIFVNLHVKDLQKTMAFFTKLGFAFNPDFTNEQGACMIIGENIFAMLVTEPFFKTFINTDICNTAKCTEALLAIDADSREAVDDMADKALEAGGEEPKPSQDYGWMYSRSFRDPDGHHWEVLYMDAKALEKIKAEGQAV